MPIGSRNSSLSNSPGCTGGMILSAIPSLLLPVVVHDLYVVGVAIFPYEAHPVLDVDPYAVLALPVAGEFLQSVARRDQQIAQIVRRVYLGELLESLALEVCGNRFGTLTIPNLPRLLVSEAPYHTLCYRIAVLPPSNNNESLRSP